MMLPFFPQTVGHGAGLHGTNSAGASTLTPPPPARSRWWSPKDGCPHAPQKLSATVLKSTAGRISQGTRLLEGQAHQFAPCLFAVYPGMARFGFVLQPHQTLLVEPVDP